MFYMCISFMSWLTFSSEFSYKWLRNTNKQKAFLKSLLSHIYVLYSVMKP